MDLQEIKIVQDAKGVVISLVISCWEKERGLATMGTCLPGEISVLRTCQTTLEDQTEIHLMKRQFSAEQDHTWTDWDFLDLCILYLVF